MAPEDLKLPSDITWQRLGYSRDMIDTNFGDFTLPPKWRSSMAVYAYVVPEEQTAESYPDSRIVYLKLSCSITGFNISEELIDPDEVSENGDELDDLQSSAWESIQSQGWANRYWPCLGAIAQIAIYPGSGDDAGPDDFPFIQDFEPKKRELYETRSESGEFLSASSEKVNIEKGATTTESTEKSDIKKGGGSASVQLGPVKLGGSASGEWGTRKSKETETVNMETTDTSQQRRETQSFSTSFSQMYQLFNGYHLGTNRAAFVITPRPHTVSDPAQVEFNLINGQRKLEGIQDMFLVIAMPKKLKGICVQANLDTGHLVARENGVILKLREEPDTEGGGGSLPPDGNDDDFPQPPGIADFPEGGEVALPTRSSRLVVTRRIIRNCGLFTESSQLDIVGADTPIDESENMVVHEEPVSIGLLERDLVKHAETPVQAKQFVANQRNRFQKRVVNSMLSGFTSARYTPKSITETKTFSDLTQLALKSISVDVDTPALKDMLSREEITLLKRLETKKIGNLYNLELDKIPGIDRTKLTEIRKKIERHVLRSRKESS